MPYGIRLKVSGEYACFTRPEMKVERVSYDVMTPSAARGILEAIHWKPAIAWVVDAIHVLKPIRFQSIRRNEVGHKAPAGKIKSAMKTENLEVLHLLVDEDRQQRAATVLVDVAYVIEAHFKMTPKAGDEDNEGKHLDIFNRRARKGQSFHQPCLGTREFPARFELIEAGTPMPACIAEQARDLGFMLYDIDHAGDRASLFFRASLVNGVMAVPAPNSPGYTPMSVLASLNHAYDRMVGRHEVPLFGYSSEKIGFLISLNADGVPAVKPVDLRTGGGKKPASPLMAVPQPVKRTSGVASNFLWDKTSYVLGVTAGEGKRLIEEHAAFIKRHADALADADDAGLNALLLFLRSWKPESFETLEWPGEMKDQNVIFALESERLAGINIHDRPAARALWARLFSEGEGSKAICLVTGEYARIARLHPSIKGVWGAQSSGASIISFNQEAFTSYDREQGDNAPVSERAAFAYTSALNKFLESGSKNRIQIGDASTVFWADASNAEAARIAEDVFLAMFNTVDENVQASKVGAILDKIRRGQPLRDFAPDLEDGVRFNILGLAPNAARLSVRFWMEDDFGQIAKNYRRFVDDMRIEPPPRDANAPLWRYLVETAAMNKRENVPPNLAGEWLRAILTGTRYPLTLLSTVLMRLRADKDVNALRVAMLKAILIRNFEMEAPVAFDPANTNKGYLLGRLFAVYEHVQSAALGRNVNATIKDKFYGSASAQPRKVFSLLESGSANHLSKVGKQSPGHRINLERLIGSIMEKMSPGDDPFPASLPSEQQALFGLGYHHQRGEFFKSKKDETIVAEEK